MFLALEDLSLQWQHLFSMTRYFFHLYLSIRFYQLFEVLKIEFDEQQISFTDLLEVFVETHDPTSLNQQGADRGTQYRSAVFYIDSVQRDLAISLISSIPDAVTEISPLDVFYPAEGYHQNYYNNDPNQSYCQMVILPKINKYFK